MSKKDKKDNISRKEVPPIIITREFLGKLSKILEDSGTCNNDCTISFKLVGSSEVIIRNNSTDFLKYYLPNNIKAIEMISDCNTQDIKIKIDFVEPSSSEFIVRGNDPKWVNEITGNIEHLFKNNMRKNDLFYSGLKKPLLIYSGFALIISYFISSLVANNWEVSDIKLYGYVFGIVIVPSLIGWHILFKRLYPKYIIKDA